jgi:hypothetical protein
MVMRWIVLFGIILFLGSSLDFAQSDGENITLTTYYPAPYGVYKEVRSKRIAIGDNYYDSSQYCWEGSCTTNITSDTSLIVEGKVGIGTPTPASNVKLEVNGHIKLSGTSPTYKITNVAPPTDDSDVATKAYVDAQIGSTYIVTTRPTYKPAQKDIPYCPSGWTIEDFWVASAPFDNSSAQTEPYCDTPGAGCVVYWRQTLCSK